MKTSRQFASRNRIEPFVMRAAEKFTLSWRKLATGAAAVLTLMLAFHVVFGENGLFLYEQKRHEARDYAAQIQQLQQENDQLQAHINDLQNDPNAIEQQAREQLHYTRPGEVIVTTPDAPAQK
ncbi:MAG TPA: septum formation initiator family protein [Acidobacteriaceae bacterium]|jgi:cell division protein FtsB|nr:septum formation initiator family protein [Acidobacteriaceae bacterium]